jgi:hypothetical protein
MKFINVTPEYGLLVRRDALAERGVSLETLLAIMKVAVPLDSNDRLISFGPSFGQEALDEFVKALSGLGLQYFDDFVEIVGDYPAWCSFKVAYAGDKD